MKRTGRRPFAYFCTASATPSKSGLYSPSLNLRIYLRLTAGASSVVRKAAAITSAGMLGATAVAEPPRVINFHCDHPFLYLITESSTGTILFAGKYTGQ